MFQCDFLFLQFLVEFSCILFLFSHINNARRCLNSVYFSIPLLFYVFLCSASIVCAVLAAVLLLVTVYGFAIFCRWHAHLAMSVVSPLLNKFSALVRFMRFSKIKIYAHKVGKMKKIVSCKWMFLLRRKRSCIKNVCSDNGG